MKTYRFTVLSVALTLALLLPGAALSAPMAQSVFTTCAAVDVPETECGALLALYDGTNGGSWNPNDWQSTNTVCGWDGVTCSPAAPWHVTGLDLSYYNLTGSLAIEEVWENLPELTHLVLAYNWLGGGVPASLTSLTNLQVLDLSYNTLTDPLPVGMENLAELTHLNLENCHMGGPEGAPIPAELGNLTKLEVLNLQWNEFKGPIPPELGDLENLVVLNLHESFRLTGGIPRELGQLTNLQELILSFTRVGGTIPPELGNLTNLERLHLWYCDLGGDIPPELGNLVELEEFLLFQNHLSGSIPPELGNLVNLRRFDAGENELTGSIPEELGQLGNLTHLVLLDNQLSGAIPVDLGYLVNLSHLCLFGNLLSGPVPMSLTNLTGLTYFLFQDTDLCEPDHPYFELWLSEIPFAGRTYITCPEAEIFVYPVAGGDTVDSDEWNVGATPADPVESAVYTPNPGTVLITEMTATPPSPSGYTLLDQLVQISAPPATPDDPLTLWFRIDVSIVPPGQDETTIEVFKDGVLVEGPCSGAPGEASPDPCVSYRALLPDGDVEISILTSRASLWTFGVPPEEQIDAMIAQVQDLVDTSVLNHGQANALSRKLGTALKSLEKGNANAACKQLEAFVNQAEAFVRSGKLTEEQGQPLIDGATVLIGQLCG